MGVYGLLSTCIQRESQCVQYVDLVELARVRGGIELLVDFYSFEHLIVDNFWKSLSSLTGNDFLKIQGGEYKMLHDYITKLVQDLISLDIHLIVFIDGAKGSSKIGSEQKFATWKKRHHRDIDKLAELLNVCTGQTKIQNISENAKVRPVLLEVQLMHTIRECNLCEVIQIPFGEADFVIAKCLKERPKAYSVITNDSDFCIFADCSFIPNQLFDLNNDLQLGSPTLLPDKPIKLSVGCICSNKVYTMLGFDHPNMMIELSIIAGNDFTGPLLSDAFRYNLGLKGRGPLQDQIAWVQQHGKVENNQLISREMKLNKKLAAAVEKSRQFYNLTLAEEEVMHKCNLSHFIEQGVREGKYPAKIMSMHLNFYWYRMLLEDISHGFPSSEFALSELRGYVYRMVLDRREHVVQEYGRGAYRRFESSGVYAVRDRFVPTVDYVNQDKIFQNLRTFHHVMTHHEPGYEIKFFERYGRKNGFVCYVLRYFLVQNYEYNLQVSQNEFMCSLAVSLGLYRCDIHQYQKLAILPTVRCVTVGNWFQNVYRHAYEYFGKLLHIHHEFPTPAEFWSGAVFTAFFMVYNHQGMVMSVGFPREFALKIIQDIKDILKEKRHMTRYIVENIFPFDDRF